ncbi:GxxExxY protein [Aeoliella sp. ICT_H6.2]|uniref:GxxExxY protein n=1 Tax=Aeoliella straminimaris TaxID=2954799 RepID=A0A9X2FI37_9BACT|nr:GxxExxY protein [Aeoliella straminimaris]MCO6046731.1 GxxExxY protein [Aeoliella straminimaris]
MEINDITRQIVDAAVKVHSHLGPGLLESVYLQCLAYELRERGLTVEKEVPLPITYFGVRIEAGFRIDLLVEDQVVIELKSVEEIAPVHKKQLLTYLRLTDKKIGLLLNFNVNLMKDGITRIANGAAD